MVILDDFSDVFDKNKKTLKSIITLNLFHIFPKPSWTLRQTPAILVFSFKSKICCV